MFEAFRARARLTATDRQAFDNKILAGAFPANEVLRQLNTQIELARAGERTSQSLKQGAILCCVFAAVAFIPALILAPIWLALPAALIALALVLALARKLLGRFVTPPQVAGTAFPFMTVLKHDLLASELVSVRIDLAGPTAATKRTKVSEPYRIWSYKVVDTTYLDPWFEGAARLADGSELRWNVTDELRVSVRRKSKSRGRTKIKYCHYKTSQIEVSVSFPTKLYRVDAVPDVARQKVSMKQTDKRCTLTVKRISKRKSLEPLEPRQLLDAIAVAFRAAKPVRGAA